MREGYRWPQQLRVNIIKMVIDGKLSVHDAQKFLKKSRPTIYRYIKEYQVQGEQFSIHKNSGRDPSNKTSNKIKTRTQKLIEEKYYDFNLTHLKEYLEKDEKICVNREVLRKWAHEKRMVKRAKKGKSKPKKRRDRMAAPGLLMQMDGSHHKWFGDKKSCFMAIIDDANSEVHFEFFESETSLACMALLKEVILNRGIFRAIYVDKAGIYEGRKRTDFTQVQRACEELGIQIIIANSAEGKGRIERLFDTFQDRLIPELRLQNINDMILANRYLKEVFLTQYWNKECTVIPSCKTSEYRTLGSHVNLDEILIYKEHRKVRRDHTFSFRSEQYLIDSNIRSSIYRQEIEIRIYSKDDFKVFFAGKELAISKVIRSSKGPAVKTYQRKQLRDSKVFNQTGEIEKRIITFSIDNPSWTERQIRKYFEENFDIKLFRTDVLGVWLRNRLTSVLERTHAQKRHLDWEKAKDAPKIEI